MMSIFNVVEGFLEKPPIWASIWVWTFPVIFFPIFLVVAVAIMGRPEVFPPIAFTLIFWLPLLLLILVSRWFQREAFTIIGWWFLLAMSVYLMNGFTPKKFASLYNRTFTAVNAQLKAHEEGQTVPFELGPAEADQPAEASKASDKASPSNKAAGKKGKQSPG